MAPRSATIFALHTWHRAVAAVLLVCMSQFTQAQEKLHQELLAKEAQRLQVLREQERREALNAKEIEALRLEQTMRMAKLATGPSASYAGRVRAKLKPNIVLLEETRALISGNPVAEVEVKASADGSITERKLIKSSGVKAWDDAVLRAIDAMEALPRDIDGRVPPWLVLSFRPKD